MRAPRGRSVNRFVTELIGKRGFVNADGDLWMDTGLRPVITYPGTTPIVVDILRIARNGNVQVRRPGDKRIYGVPQRNIERFPAREHRLHSYARLIARAGEVVMLRRIYGSLQITEEVMEGLRGDPEAMLNYVDQQRKERGSIL